MMTRRVLAIALLGLLGPAGVLAQTTVGTAFTYQGQLKQAGTPANGPYDFVLRLFDDPNAGAQIGDDVLIDDCPIDNGLFTVQLDFGNGAFTGNALWLEVAARPGDSGDDYTVLSPRQELTPTPYALYALNSRHWAAGGDDIYNANSGNVGIGTDTPEHPLHVSGNLRSDDRVALCADGLFGPDSYWEWVFDTSQRFSDFSGATGWSPFWSAFTLDPTEDLTDSNAKYIYSHYLETHIPETNDQDFEYVQGPYLAAFHSGTGTINLLAGGFLGAESYAGHVLWQIGTEITSDAAGIGSLTDNVGLRVETGHRGTDGSITNNYGMYMITPHHTRPIENHYGIYLEDQDVAVVESYAIYVASGDTHLNGNLDVTGTVSKGGGSFKIDHPLDPENKYLYHSFVESPDMMNVYNGNVLLDGHGEAFVTMPEWFEALNRDFRYQLTCIGGFAPVYVAERIHQNRFKIAGGKPGLEVSWQVTGIRQDPFANANRIPVEEDKPDYARGYYLHPMAHGLPADRHIENAGHDRRGRPSSEAREALEKGLRRPARTQ